MNSTTARSPWKRFSLRTFLIAITAACVLLGWKASRVNVQRPAITKIENASGTVVLSSQSAADGVGTAPSSNIWNPLRGKLDDLWFDSVRSVRTPHLNEDSRRTGKKYLSDEIYSLSLGFPDLRNLQLSYSDISNEEVTTLGKLSKLQSLDLSCTRIREGPMNGLRHLPLKWLSIRRTRLDDEGIADLKGMTTLEHLDLTRTKVSDAGIEILTSLKSLKLLRIRRTLITEDGYQQIKHKLPKCTVWWEPLVTR